MFLNSNFCYPFISFPATNCKGKDAVAAAVLQLRFATIWPPIRKLINLNQPHHSLSIIGLTCNAIKEEEEEVLTGSRWRAWQALVARNRKWDSIPWRPVLRTSEMGSHSSLIPPDWTRPVRRRTSASARTCTGDRARWRARKSVWPLTPRCMHRM